MENILDALYNGRIFPAEQFSPKEKEYKEIVHSSNKHVDEFTEMLRKLDPPLDQKYIEIADEQMDMIPYEFSCMFIEGFRLGAKIMVEVFQEKSSR